MVMVICDTKVYILTPIFLSRFLAIQSIRRRLWPEWTLEMVKDTKLQWRKHKQHTQHARDRQPDASPDNPDFPGVHTIQC